MARSNNPTTPYTTQPTQVPSNPLGRTGNPTIAGRNTPGGSAPKPTVTDLLFHVIPGATIPNDPSGQQPPTKTHQEPSKAQVLVAGRDAVIPLVYGGPVRMAGKLYTVRLTSAGKLLVVLMLCEGPIGSFGKQQLNDADLPASPAVSNPAAGGTKYTYSNGVVVTLWDGSQTTVDADLLATIPGLTETYTNTAYAVCQVPANVGSGFPRFTFEVNGLKVHDPRMYATLKWPLLTSLVPTIGPTNPTYTRASAAYVPGYDGVLRSADTNEARFRHARRVKNLAQSSEDLTVAPWNHFQTTVSTITLGIPAGYSKATLVTETTAVSFHDVDANLGLVVGRTYAVRFLAKPNGRDWGYASDTSGSRVLTFNAATGEIGTSSLGISRAASKDLGGGWRLFTYQYVQVNASGTFALFVESSGDVVQANAGDGVSGMYFTGVQIEDITGATNQNPSEYVSAGVLSAPYHGAGVDGVQYFDTENGNAIVGTIFTEGVGDSLDQNVNQHAWFPSITGFNNYLSTPDSNLNRASGNVVLSFRAKVMALDYTLAHRDIIAKWNTPDKRAWRFALNGGKLSFGTTQTGLDSEAVTLDSTVSHGFPNGVAFWARCDYDVERQNVTFYTSDDGKYWAQLGAAQSTGYTKVYNGTGSDLWIGQRDTSLPFQGAIYHAEVYANGRLISKFDPDRYVDGAWTEPSTGEAWALNGVVKIVNLPLTGVLLEDSVTNFAAASEDFTGAFWTKTNCSIGGGTTLLPTGFSAANCKVIEDATSNVHGVQQVVLSKFGAQKYIGSFFVRPDDRQFVYIQIDDGVNAGMRCWFNLVTGEVGSHSGFNGGNGDFTFVSATIEPAAYGFYRVSLGVTTNSFNGNVVLSLFLSTGDTVTTYVGGGTAGVYAWGAQLDQSAQAQAQGVLSYITGGTTRASDSSITLPSTGLVDINEGTAVGEVRSFAGINFATYVIGLSSNLTMETVSDGEGSKIGFSDTINGEYFNASFLPPEDREAMVRGMITWKGGQSNVYVNDGAESATGPYLGEDDGIIQVGASFTPNGCVRNVEVYKKQISVFGSTQFPTSTSYAVLDIATDPNKAWSDNPALCLGDFLSSTVYGARKSVDWASVADAADYCDELVGTSPQEKRALIALLLDTKQPIREWIETLRGYVPAWIDYVGQKVMVIADKPEDEAEFIFNPDNILTDNLPTMVKRGVKDTPNVVQVTYTRTDLTPWATDLAEASAAASIRRVARIDMPGIQRHSQALRFATERLNHYRLEDVEGTLNAAEDGLKLVIGNRVSIVDDLVSGPGDELVPDPTFASPSDWVLGTGHSIATNLLTISSSVDAATSTGAGIEASGAFKVVFTIDSITQGSVSVGFADVGSRPIAHAGTYSFTFTQRDGGDDRVYIRSWGSTDAVVSSVSVKQLIALEARVMGKQDLGHGRWAVAWREYQGSSYNSDVVLPLAPPTSGLPDPTFVQPPTSLSLVEKFYIENTDTPPSGQTGLIYQSRVEITWVKSTHIYPVIYTVTVKDQTTGTVIYEGQTRDNKLVSPPVQQGAGQTYLISVVAHNSIGVSSDSSCSGTITIQGKNLPPGNVPSITNAFELGGEVFLFWEQAPDIDTIRYEWRYGTVSGFTWDNPANVVLDKVDGLFARYKGIPSGTWRFAIKAIDSLGNYSPDAVTVDVVVTTDANSFINSHEFTSPAAPNDTQLGMRFPPVWATGTTGFASTPDSAKVSVTGDIDIRVDAFLPTTIPVGASTIVSKYPGAAGQQSYIFSVNPNGTLVLSWTSDGSTNRTVTSTESVSLGSRVQVRVILDVNNGAGGHTATFYQNTSIDPDLQTWTQLGTPVSAGAFTTSIFDGTSILRLGIRDETTGSNPSTSVVLYRALVMNGIDGTMAADFYPARDGAVNSSSLVSALSGETWTISYPPMMRTAATFSNELVANGMLSADVSWSKGTGWAISGGVATATGATGDLSQVILTAGKLYRITFTVTAYTSGGLRAICGSGNLSATVNAVGTYVFYMQATGTTFGINPNGATTASVDNVSVVECNNMLPILPLEGVWEPRWETDFDAEHWSSLPNPLSGGANPVGSYGGQTGLSRWQSEPWDLGVTVTGNWSIVTDTTLIAGASVISAMETSPDGSAWTRQQGISWQGVTRFIRSVIEGANTSTRYRVNSPPKINLAALMRPETGQVSSSNTGGILVQLANAYVAAQDLQLTCVFSGTTPSNASAVYDRLLVNPQTGLMISWIVPPSVNANVGVQISNPARVVLADDYLEYDVFIDTSSPAFSGFSDGGVYVHCTDGTASTTTSNFLDTNGVLDYGPNATLDAAARGVWFSRKIKYGQYIAGKTIDKVALYSEADGAGTHKVIYRNARFTDGAGTLRQSVWVSGEPTTNTTITSVNSTNVQCGPSNSFRVYAFNGATQLNGQLVNWSFKGF